jgi:hypothetical protein
VDSCSDMFIHKASIAFKIQMFGRQSSSSGRASTRSTIWRTIPLVWTRKALV